MEKICLECRKKIYKPKRYSLKKWIKRKFCSRACYNASAFRKQTFFKKGHRNTIMEKNPAWKGGRIMRNGYIQVAIGKRKYKFEHRLVMERYLNRSLQKFEDVHHLDGNKINNKLSNLVLIDKSSHQKIYHPNNRYKNQSTGFLT